MEEPKHLEMTSKEVKELLDHLETSNLPEGDRKRLRGIVEAMLWMGQKLEDKDLTIMRLRRLFGVKTESASNLGLKDNSEDDDKKNQSGGSQESSREAKNSNEESKPKGHNGGDDYPDAERTFVPHETLKPGDICPECQKGRVYEFGAGCVVRLIGQAPIKAKIYEPQQLRCSTCLAFYTAALPADAGESRADPTAKAIAAIFRYGSGIPFYRTEKLQDIFNTPVPDSTQWDWAESLLNCVYPVFGRLQVWAAQGEMFHSDDTGMRVVQLKKRLIQEKSERTGIYTTGLISKVFGHEVALFFTGNRHAGENLGAVLEKRCPTARPPKLMCDALASNTSTIDIEINDSRCLDHARRQFVDVLPKYREESGHFILTLKKVYQNDKLTKLCKMKPVERLEYHKNNSLPIMEGLKTWCEENLGEKRVEPNSKLGGVMAYFINHYEKLTKFAKEPGFPLSNCLVEQLLKTSVLHRKNSLFYQTEMGALVGDVMMSLIQTAKRAKVNVLDYLTKIQLFAKDVKENPDAWLPWNYRARATLLAPAT